MENNEKAIETTAADQISEIKKQTQQKDAEVQSEISIAQAEYLRKCLVIMAKHGRNPIITTKKEFLYPGAIQILEKEGFQVEEKGIRVVVSVR